jgi:muconate cycloisomerase
MEWGTELFGPLLLVDDILEEPLIYSDFALQVPTKPGLGVRVDRERLARFARN